MQRNAHVDAQRKNKIAVNTHKHPPMKRNNWSVHAHYVKTKRKTQTAHLPASFESTRWAWTAQLPCLHHHRCRCCCWLQTKAARAPKVDGPACVSGGFCGEWKLPNGRNRWRPGPCLRGRRHPRPPPMARTCVAHGRANQEKAMQSEQQKKKIEAKVQKEEGMLGCTSTINSQKGRKEKRVHRLVCGLLS